jgi:hypothetical protein
MPPRPHYLSGPSFAGSVPRMIPEASWNTYPIDGPLLSRVAQRGGYAPLPGYGGLPNPFAGVKLYGAMDPFTAMFDAVTAVTQTAGSLITGRQQQKQSERDAAMQTQNLQTQQQIAIVGAQSSLASAASQERLAGLALAGGLAITTILGAVVLLRPRKSNPRRRNRGRR